MRPAGVLEACVYAVDLPAAKTFYERVLGLVCFADVAGRHVFFRCGDAVFLVFNPEHTATVQTAVNGVPIPLHGARGPGHVAFRVGGAELPAWRRRLDELGVAIEAEVSWPSGGRSLYVRDPAGNSVELATPETWGVRSRSAS
ncbi:MAG TPA: VOC family protein [Gemmatimonadales bacterium]|jgi:catechol 2,3-dioxygenase-like lactoylglutathione lyase family enzyme